MNILLASSEIVPFAKSGGLGDVCSALPKQIARLGHEVCVFLPAFRTIHDAGVQIESTGHELSIPMGSKIVRGQILKSHLPDSTVPAYFIDQPEYFERKSYYGENGIDYADNCERFIFFCRGVVEAIRSLQLNVDLIHCNDWQTGLIPAYLEIEYRKIPLFERIATLMTIHNLAFQGRFWHWDMALTGLDWKFFNWQQMEFYDQLNLLKTGIVFADQISTVSKRYAEEIQTPEFGCGLEGVLSDHRDRLSGILNGVDNGDWNPACDAHLPAKYSVQNWREGKAACKQHLQRELGLPESDKTPLIGLVGRLEEQKGWDLIIEVIKSWAPGLDVQWAILGTGKEKYHQALEDLVRMWPQRVAASLNFSNPLAHQIEAGADMFLMPSQYEPCGLNQLYSLKYGAVPIVRGTGGLADTIVDASPETLASGTANGFSFSGFDTHNLQTALRRAMETYRDRPEQWAKIVETGMSQDWSWNRSAQQYIDLYQRTIRRRRDSF